MRKVTCHECSKRYDYDDDGFCPGCGAFNTPARASRIAADGSVIWVDGLNERNHRNSFVHEELHREERKRRWMNLDRDPVETVVRLTGKGKPAAVTVTGGGKKKGMLGLGWVILALVIGVNFLLPLIAALFLGW